MYPGLTSKSRASKRHMNVKAMCTQSSVTKAHPRYRKFSPEVAPAVMFQKNKGLGDMEMSAQVTRVCLPCQLFSYICTKNLHRSSSQMLYYWQLSKNTVNASNVADKQAVEHQGAHALRNK